MTRHGLVRAFVLIITIGVTVPGLSAALPNGGWDAAWSPNGDLIAFTSGSPHSIPNLWVANADGTGMRKLTTRGAHEPRWLPDGKTIVFGTVRSGEAVYMSIDYEGEPNGEKPIEILPPGAEDPMWSPSGSLVAFAVQQVDGKSRDLWFTRAGGGGSSGLTSKFWVREWTWSPDGSHLAFVVGKATGTSVWTVSPGEKDVRLLYRGFCGAPAYSPDGTKLALAVPDVRSGFKIIIIDLETGLDKRIAVRTFDGKKITWSPDGKRLFFASSRKSEPSIWSVGSNGKGLERLTPEGIAAFSPSLSADGGKIAFHAMDDDSYSPELYVCNANGEELRKLTRSSASYWSPVWSPDGKKLAFQSDKKHIRQLFVGSSSGRKAKGLVEILDSAPVDVSWCSDGKSLLLADTGRLFSLDTAGGKGSITPFKSLTNPVQSPRVSGNEVYFTEWRGWNAGISALKLDGTEKRMLTNKPEEQPETQPEPEKKEEVSPSADRAGQGVLVASVQFFIAQGSPGIQPESETGNPHAGLGLMGPHPNIGGQQEKPQAVVDVSPAVSPDGKLVAFTRGGQIWLVGSDGADERQLTQFGKLEGSEKRMVSNPLWSLRGDSILFQVFTNHTGKLAMELWIAGLETGSERLIYSENVDSEYGVYYRECTSVPVFAPGGDAIIFTSMSSGEPRIVSVTPDGSNVTELVHSPSSFPAIDQSGKKLAYVDLKGSQERICVLDLTSGKVKSSLFR